MANIEGQIMFARNQARGGGESITGCKCDRLLRFTVASLGGNASLKQTPVVDNVEIGPEWS